MRPRGERKQPVESAVRKGWALEEGRTRRGGLANKGRRGVFLKRGSALDLKLSPVYFDPNRVTCIISDRRPYLDLIGTSISLGHERLV